MKQTLIAVCGLNCEKCNARIATINNDDALREATAQLWAKLNNAPITAEQINCMGCRTEGVKTIFCSEMCPIRQCAKQRGFETCGECNEWKTCPKVEHIRAEAEENLQALRRD